MKNISLKVRLISTFLVLLIISTGALLLTTQIEYSRQMIDELYDAEFNSLKARSLVLDEGIRLYDELSVQLFSDKDISNAGAPLVTDTVLVSRNEKYVLLTGGRTHIWHIHMYLSKLAGQFHLSRNIRFF